MAAQFTLASKVRHLKQKDFSDQGDCMRTCIAMLLGCTDPEEVPHFLELEGPGSGWDKADKWLNDHGFSVVHIWTHSPSPEIFFRRLQNQLTGGCAAIVGGMQSDFDHHAIVVTENEIFDPGYDVGEPHCISMPNWYGEYWVSFILPKRDEA